MPIDSLTTMQLLLKSDSLTGCEGRLAPAIFHFSFDISHFSFALLPK